ncbi:MAG: F0F1 ATP synthase subunit alpha [Verrucomicrobiota bacterium]|nr:F0F1 ATP synthase subunit alpha [Verrucomicrobiota bacterium]
MSSLSGSPIPLFKIKVEEKGKILDIKEIIARIQGLPSCLNGQIVDLGDGVKGIIMGFDEKDVLALVLGDRNKLRLGGEVSGISEPFKIPVGEQFIGRMVTALGVPCDEGEAVGPDAHMPVFRQSPPITHRAHMEEFLPTGTKIIDIMVPIAKGQRQLILGDRMTGKTVISVDAILNQKERNTVCIYCAVGKSVSALEKVATTLHDAGALDYTIFMVATDNSPVGEQYLAPYSAATLGEYFAGKGRDVLIVFDDLTKHAWAYRQLSLLLERPPGREAYPGDIFYVQTQLMERAGKFNEEHGGGSMTFIGIAETLQGDLTGYIPSNLTSMCDGQVCMSGSAFAEGFRPAIDILLSLSIIGGRAQPPILKSLAMDLRADFARYNEILRLSKLQSSLSGESERIVHRGRVIMSILQQSAHFPASLAEQAILLYALKKDMIESRPEAKKRKFYKEIYPFAQANSAELLLRIEQEQKLTEEIDAGIAALVANYLQQQAHLPVAERRQTGVEKT